MALSAGRAEQALNQNRLDKADFMRLLSNNFPLLSILFGSALFTYAAGPFQNFDSSVEFQAASAVMKYGVPYNANAGTMYNMPPMGFYFDSISFRIFGLTLNAGVATVTLFGLGCIVLVYLIGKAWYGKTTGLVAAALFAATPWQVIFSRSFLIDAQCLFFSLLFLLIGFYAIQRNSLWLFMLSGIFLGVAFLTKYYAIFMLLPLAILYFHRKPKKLWHPLAVLGFFVPVVAFLLVWYQEALRANILTILGQDDFRNYNSAGLTPSGFFTLNFLYTALGAFFLAAVIISLLLSSFQTKIFKNVLAFDLTCLATILLVAGVDTLLGWGLNFSAPFTSAAKYDYQALPFLCLLAGSTLSKSKSLFKAAETRLNRRRLFLGAACLGVACVVIAIFSNFYYVSQYSHQDTVAFNVEKGVSFAFSNSGKLAESNGLTYLQYAGFALLISGLVWAFRDKLKTTKSEAE